MEGQQDFGQLGITGCFGSMAEVDWPSALTHSRQALIQTCTSSIRSDCSVCAGMLAPLLKCSCSESTSAATNHVVILLTHSRQPIMYPFTPCVPFETSITHMSTAVNT